MKAKTDQKYQYMIEKETYKEQSKNHLNILKYYQMEKYIFTDLMEQKIKLF